MDKNTTYHFIGIKGTGMSALALILNDLGAKVQGSDIEKFSFTESGLKNAGIQILPFDGNNITEGLTAIAGNSFNDDHPEIKKAREMGLTVYRYHEFLGELIKGTTSIGIAGAHGKTSTTGLLSHVLSEVEPTNYLIGDGTGKAVPDAKFFVYEADEYRRHFLATYPDYAIMTNVDFDHPDYYKDEADVVSAFQTFANQVKKGIFAWGEDKNLRNLTANAPIYYYGLNEDDDFRAVNIKRTTTGSEFTVYYHDENLGEFSIPLFGEHSVLNTLAVIAVAYFEKIDLNQIKAELQTFKGVKRRFSEKQVKDITIIDDYAHHPSEIKATLDAARQEHPDKEIVAVFQPHTFSRTIALMDGFVDSLNLADKVFLTNIYSSPREKSGNVTSQDIANKIKKDSEVITLDNLNELLLSYKNAVMIFMGAGDIQKYEDAYVTLLNEKH